MCTSTSPVLPQSNAVPVHECRLLTLTFQKNSDSYQSASNATITNSAPCRNNIVGRPNVGEIMEVTSRLLFQLYSERSLTRWQDLLVVLTTSTILRIDEVSPVRYAQSRPCRSGKNPAMWCTLHERVGPFGTARQCLYNTRQRVYELLNDS